MKRIAFGILWFVVFWIGGGAIGGGIAGGLAATHTDSVAASKTVSEGYSSGYDVGKQAGREFGRKYGLLVLGGALILSVARTAMGLLPGTRGKVMPQAGNGKPWGQ